ncbi:hypothetical protein J437_LFUL008529 [Ladona fulva]|uniref:Uncharacterized protein n=1 Tax=Ladona fulva TaxID=123851 RepID=A0A8K0P1E8_LADFU|nr:hypothetical protein J437_LFUL008529 [Ladona fulva]
MKDRNVRRDQSVRVAEAHHLKIHIVDMILIGALSQSLRDQGAHLVALHQRDLTGLVVEAQFLVNHRGVPDLGLHTVAAAVEKAGLPHALLLLILPPQESISISTNTDRYPLVC